MALETATSLLVPVLEEASSELSSMLGAMIAVVEGLEQRRKLEVDDPQRLPGTPTRSFRPQEAIATVTERVNS